MAARPLSSSSSRIVLGLAYRLQRHRWIALVAACLSLLPVQTARGNSVPIVSNIKFPLDSNELHGDGMVGWNFALLQPITVSQVGWYDNSGTGLSRSFQIGLWFHPTVGPAIQLLGDPTTGILVPGGTQAALNGVYRVIDLPTPLELQPGGYNLAGLDSATTPDVIKFIGPLDVQVPSYLTIGPASAASGCLSGFQEPKCFFLEPGPELELGPMLFAAVPEPGTGLLVMAGVLGLAIKRHRTIEA